MTLLAKYISKEKELKRLEVELKVLKSNSRLQQEIAFKNRIEALMAEYNQTRRDVVALLYPEHPSTLSNDNLDGRKRRNLKVYKNPYTNEVIETRGRNHKVIRAWKKQYGQEEVRRWVISESP